MTKKNSKRSGGKYSRKCLHAATILAAISPAFVMAESAPILEEVVVTAQKRAQNLQDVPITITALSAEKIGAAGIDSIMDIGLVTPGLNFTQTTVFAQPFIRGIGTDSFSPGNEASVATYIDGVYYSDMGGGNFALNNIERIEVLKGPQGTLYGRNSTGGLLNIVTKTPTQELAAAASLSLGNYNATEFQGYVSGGVSETVAADLAIYVRDQGEGYYDNLTTGNDIVREEGTYLRSKWVISASDALTVTLAGSYVDYTNTLALVRQPGPGTVPALPPGTFSTEPGKYYMTRDPVGDSKQWGGSARVDWELDSVKFVSITAYNKSDLDQYIDGDDSSSQFADVIANTEHKQFTQEFQLLSNYDSDLTWVTGFFYQKSDSGWKPFSVISEGVTFFELDIFSETEAAAVFADATYSLNEKSSLTAGLRYNYDEKNYDNEAISEVPETSWTEPTGRLVYDYRFTDNLMMFASYNRGYKSGAYNTVDRALHDAVDPEIVDAYEIGFKADFLDNRVRINGGLFYTEFNDIQVRAQLPDNTGTTLQNAAEAEIKGFDADIEFLATESLQLTMGVSYIDSEYVDFPEAETFVPVEGGAGNSLVIADVSGNKLVRTPDWTVNMGLDYRHSLGDHGLLSIAGNLFVSDDVPWDTSNRLTTDGYQVLNLKIGWEPVAGNWNVEVWAKNLTDETYENYVTTSATDDRFSYAQPLTYGIRFGYEY